MPYPREGTPGRAPDSTANDKGEAFEEGIVAPRFLCCPEVAPLLSSARTRTPTGLIIGCISAPHSSGTRVVRPNSFGAEATGLSPQRNRNPRCGEGSSLTSDLLAENFFDRKLHTLLRDNVFTAEELQLVGVYLSTQAVRSLLSLQSAAAARLLEVPGQQIPVWRVPGRLNTEVESAGALRRDAADYQYVARCWLQLELGESADDE